jgi:aminopeptidase
MTAKQEDIRSLIDTTAQIERGADFNEAVEFLSHGIVEEAAKVQAGQKVLIWFDTPAIPLVKEVEKRCQEIGADVRFFMREYERDAESLTVLGEEEIKQMFDEEEALMNWAENVLILRNPEDPEALGHAPADKVKAYLNRYGQVHQRRVSGQVEWTLFYWPTEYEANLDGVSYDEYFRECVDGCKRPWEEVKAGQQVLKEKLDKGKVLEFHANEDDADPNKQTHITMSIEGMTFCNSTIGHNYPGSEVFSAPQINSVNGQIYAEGSYLYDGYLMRNIFLEVKNGRIIEAYAEEGNDGLQAILNRNDSEPGFGSRYFGECAIGTNVGLLRRFFNPLLNEKVGGSFHMAIGSCYDIEMHDGEPVNVNNGNTDKKTSVHWDLTVLMKRKPDGTGGGRIVLDGVVIQIDGQFLDPALAVLNGTTQT